MDHSDYRREEGLCLGSTFERETLLSMLEQLLGSCHYYQQFFLVLQANVFLSKQIRGCFDISEVILLQTDWKTSFASTLLLGKKREML